MRYLHAPLAHTRALRPLAPLLALLLVVWLIQAARATPIAQAADPNFTTRRLLGSPEDQISSVAVGDLNGDGTLDIVAGSRGLQSVVYFNDGHGAFAPARRFSPVTDLVLSVAVGDLNGDGALDIIAGNRDSQSAVYF